MDSLFEDHFNDKSYSLEAGVGFAPRYKICKYCGKDGLWFDGGRLKERNSKGFCVPHECDFSKLLDAS